MLTAFELIGHFSEDVASRITLADQQLTVPSCPEWTLGDLVFHLGSVQSFWAANLLARDRSSPLSPGNTEDPSDDALIQWFRSCTASLLSALREVGDDSPCWTWWGDPFTSGAVARHQVQEVAVHRWDVGLALDERTPLDGEVAHDGVGEFLEVHAQEIPAGDESTVTFRSTDSDGSWKVGAGGSASATVSGTASDLVLFLNGRIPLASITVEGSLSAVQVIVDSVNLQ